MKTPAAVESVESVDRGASWFARRARNAARRRARIAVVGSIAFFATLLALVIVPRQRQAEARVIASALNQRVDTASFIAGRDQAREALAAAEEALAGARLRASRPPRALIVDTLPAALVVRRDWLARAEQSLTTMLERVENAPLPASYRALGEMPELAGDPRVGPLLDSLAAIERERDAFGLVGGVDPVFVALTARATAIGRELQAIAEGRRAAARAELQRLRAPTRPPVVATTIDTVPFLERRDTSVAVLDSMTRALDGAREFNAGLERRAAAARAAADVVIPPFAMLAAAVIIGVGAGFGVALLMEVRRARVADAEEVEAATGVRVLAVVRPRPPQPERSRRRADWRRSPLIDPGSDEYRLLYLHLAGVVPRLGLITVTGDDRHIAATVAANLATAAAYDARTTLLVDGELTAGLVAPLLRVRRSPGLAEILTEGVDWTETIVSASVGRDRTLDVITSGARQDPRRGIDATPMRQSLGRIANRYDFVILVASPPHIQLGSKSMIAAPDVVYCVATGVTPLGDAAAGLAALRGVGARVRGIVVWDAGAPEIDDAPISFQEPAQGSPLLSAGRTAR